VTLAEMQGLFADAGLLPKVQAACVVACEAIRTEAAVTANHTARVAWAKAALADPTAVGGGVLRAVLAQNAGLTVAQAQAASDAALQSAVNNAINLFTLGG
jgi:uncharacterized membrane protein YeiH